MSTELTKTPESEVEIYALDLDWDLVQHLANPESVRALQGECIDPSLIEDEEAKDIFLWQMNHTREHGHPATPTVLEDEFDELSLEAPQTQVGDLIKRLRERYVKNNSHEAMRDLAAVIREHPLATGTEMMRVGRKLSTLVTSRGESYGTHDWDRAVAHYDQQVLKGPGPTLGFKELDEHFNGIAGVTFLIAPPKRYKSWFSVNVMREQIENKGYPNYYSLELPAVDVKWRLSCMVNQIPYWKYLKSKLTPQEQKMMKSTMGLLENEAGRWEIEKPEPGARSAVHLIERSLNRGASCVIIDQLQYVENSKGASLGAANDTGNYWETCNILRDYSDEIPIFVVHQFNRSVMNATERPEMQQAKGSSAIEEVGTLVLGMWSNREMRQNSIVETYTLASRNFGFGVWALEANLSAGCSIDMRGAIEDE